MGTVGLHRARFAYLFELLSLLSFHIRSDGVLLGVKRVFLIFRGLLQVRGTKKRPEIGNLLIVAPTRSGKSLLATSQLLTWRNSVIVNDIKGELYHLTAGYRSKLGTVFVIDPRGYGHRFDPLAGKQSEEAFESAATHLLYRADEGEGSIFTERATVMLTQIFLAAKYTSNAPFPYTRYLIRSGLTGAAKQLNNVSSHLATQFLDASYREANFTDRFLLSSWSTLTTRMRPLLTPTVIRSLTTSDFTPGDIVCSDKPVTVYLRWQEQDLLSLSPLVRLLWGTLINELTTAFDTRKGKGCRPVLLVIDEAGRTAIPSLAEYATTVVGRGITLWLAFQSLSQIETVYGKARAQTLRDNMDSQLYYRPADFATARYLEERLGSKSGYAHSQTLREGEETSEGRSERQIPLMTAQEILQMNDEHVIGFHRRLPPFKARRVDFREFATLRNRQKIKAPRLSKLPEIREVIVKENSNHDTLYIDPDAL